jgi:AbrB family looped-hinge helix DNA binding protein
MVVTVTSKGQVTLPVEARRRLGIHAGTQLEVVVRGDDRLEVVRLGGSVRGVKGLLPRPRKTLSLADMDAAIAKGAGG